MWEILWYFLVILFLHPLPSQYVRVWAEFENSCRPSFADFYFFFFLWLNNEDLQPSVLRRPITYKKYKAILFISGGYKGWYGIRSLWACLDTLYKENTERRSCISLSWLLLSQPGHEGVVIFHKTEAFPAVISWNICSRPITKSGIFYRFRTIPKGEGTTVFWPKCSIFLCAFLLSLNELAPSHPGSRAPRSIESEAVLNVAERMSQTAGEACRNRGCLGCSQCRLGSWHKNVARKIRKSGRKQGWKQAKSDSADSVRPELQGCRSWMQRALSNHILRKGDGGLLSTVEVTSPEALGP